MVGDCLQQDLFVLAQPIEVSFSRCSRAASAVTVNLKPPTLTMLLTHKGAAAYGGALVNLFVSADRAAELRRESAKWPSWDLTPTQSTMLELLANGSLSPLRGFMSRREHDSMSSSGRLPNGRLWTLPVLLEVDDSVIQRVTVGSSVALRDAEGVMLAALHVEDIWGAAHAADNRRPWRLGGTVDVVNAPEHHDFRSLRLSPAAVRSLTIGDPSPNLIAVHAVQPLSVALAEHVDQVRRSRQGRVLIHALSAPVRRRRCAPLSAHAKPSRDPRPLSLEHRVRGAPAAPARSAGLRRPPHTRDRQPQLWL